MGRKMEWSSRDNPHKAHLRLQLHQTCRAHGVVRHGIISYAWFQLEWDNEICQKHIAVKELIVILTAVFVWGLLLHGKRVTSNWDNCAVVTVLNSRYSRDKDLVQLLCCLFFLEAIKSIYPQTMSLGFSMIV